MAFKEYGHYDATGLADLVRKKKISPRELCDEAIRRIEKLNPKLNAVISTMYDTVDDQIKNIPPGASFPGVPFLLKDVHHAFMGVPMSQGSEEYKTIVSDRDAEIVTRFRRAGLVCIGKTNTPEFKAAYITEPKAFGPTRNPWNTDFASGGSSGGSASAVSAGLVPIASATDEGGSIRVPSSYCGVFGLKPSRGRNPVGPDFTEELDGLSTSHVITRSVRDSAAMLDALSGIEPGSPYGFGKSAKSFVKAAALRPGKLRIAVNLRPAYGMDLHPECVKAVEETAKLLRRLGHVVESAAPEYREEDAGLVQSWFMAMHMAVRLSRASKTLSRPMKKLRVELPSLAVARIGLAMSSAEAVEMQQRCRSMGYAMSRFLENYDMILSPTLGLPPVRAGSLKSSKADVMSMKMLCSAPGKILLGTRGLREKIMGQVITQMMRGQLPLTPVANLTGQPAMSLPLHWTPEGLPCGVQFIGRLGDEAGLLALATVLEKERPWFDRRPAGL